MKKLLALILALLMTTFVFTSCHPKAIYYGTFDSSSYEDEIDLFSSLNDVEIYIPGIQECQDASDWEYVVKKYQKNGRLLEANMFPAFGLMKIRKFGSFIFA